MISNYIGYYFKKSKVRKNKSFLFDISKFLKNAANGDWQKDTSLQFKHGGESVFLVHIKSNKFIFLKTLDKDILKSINKTTLDFKNLRELSRSNNSISLASFLIIGPSYIAIASSSKAPASGVLKEYIKYILTGVGLQDFNLILKSFEDPMSISEAQNLFSISGTSLVTSPLNTFGNKTLKAIGLEPTSTEVSSIKIVLSSERNKDITSESKDLLNTVNPSMIDSLRVRARKDDIDDALTDYILIGKSKLSDRLDVTSSVSDLKILNDMYQKLKNNSELREKVNDLCNDLLNNKPNVLFKTTILKFNNSSSWRDFPVPAD